jgi:hypothetical protein
MDKDKSMDVSNSRANNTKTLAIAWGTSNSMDKTKIMDASKSYANNIRNTCNSWVPATARTPAIKRRRKKWRC